MKIAIILGTRPEIIKMSPIIRECENRNLDYFVLHTGQHYSYEMDKIFFDELELPTPKYNLNVGSGSHAEETGKILMSIEKTLIEEKPDVVLVEGDTNTVLAGALAAAKLHIKVGHVEAGGRSYDKNMPEEINRILTDHISEYLFASTENAKNILIREGIFPEGIIVTGSTIVEAITHNLKIATRSEVLIKRGLDAKGYFLATLHRQESVDDPEKLSGILAGLNAVYKEFNMPIIFPIHPRTEDRLKKFGLSTLVGIEIVAPLGYIGFLHLEQQAALILTDSGGVQMEACILQVPCVTLRDNTEWSETVEVGANTLSGCKANNIVEATRLMLNRNNSWENPFGDGRAGIKTIEFILGKEE